MIKWDLILHVIWFSGVQGGSTDKSCHFLFSTLPTALIFIDGPYDSNDISNISDHAGLMEGLPIGWYSLILVWGIPIWTRLFWAAFPEVKTYCVLKCGLNNRTKHDIDDGVFLGNVSLQPSPGSVHGFLWDPFGWEIPKAGNDLSLISQIDQRNRSTSSDFSCSKQQHRLRMEKEDQSNKLRDG